MKMRIQADLIFNNPQDATLCFASLKKLTKALVTLNEGADMQEQSYITLHPCHHDTDPKKPCEITEAWTSHEEPPPPIPPPF